MPVWALILGSCVAMPTHGADDPQAVGTKDDAPVYIFLEGGAEGDLEAVRKRLARPNFVILSGAKYDALRARAKGPAIAVEPLRGLIESVAVGGEVLDDLAHLTIDCGIALVGPDAVWVPIRLDKLYVSAAREGDRELPIRTVDGSWQVQLKGEGVHRVQITLSTPVVSVPGDSQARRLALAIPEAASTRVQLVLGSSARDVVTVGAAGAREPLQVEPIEAGQRNRVAEFLTPRRTLELAWKIASDPGVVGPPLVTAQGEISLEVERGSLRARSSWEVRAERGTVRKLELRVDPADELVGLECDGRPVAGDEPRDAASGTLTVPLIEPLGPGGSVRLVVTTRRALAPETTSRMTYRGVPLLNVAAQTGVLAIAQPGGDPWISDSPGRGLRQIDPRSELPAGLRARPSIIKAYQFVEQPFDLGLQVDPSPPWVRVKSRTTITVDSNRARVDCWLDYAVARGRVFEVQVALPESMTLDQVGPETTVAASERLARTPGQSSRTLVARLSPKASADGEFSIHLAGWQPITPGTTVPVLLPSPMEAQSRGGLLAVLGARNISVELGRDPASPPGDFRPAGHEPPAAWAWPPESEIAAMPPALWLRHDDAPASIALQLTARARTVQEETTLDAQIDRRRLEVRQETTLRVRFGSLGKLDVSVPPEAEGFWDVEGAEVVRREPIGPDRDGSARYRLFLGREVTDTARLRFRIRRPLATAIVANRATRLLIPSIKISGVESSPMHVRVAADEGIDLAAEGKGWRDVAEDDVSTNRDSGPAARLERTGTGPSAILATAHAVASLPRLVASRLWLRTTRDADAALRTTAFYRLETHDGALVVSLPDGAEWVRAKIGTETLADVERMAHPVDAFRLKLPTDSADPVLVTLEYIQRGGGSAWGIPRLLEGGIVQETYWEVRIPWSLALTGTPEGWSDENDWHWNAYALMRRPSLTPEALSLWVTGASPKARIPADPGQDGAHGYLFARVGNPADLRPRIVSRAGLVGGCSGAVLAIGLLLMLARPWVRLAWVLLPIALLAAAVSVAPSVILLVVQSSTLGCVLVVVAALTQRFVERRRMIPAGFAEPSGLIVGGPSGSGHAGPAEAGSDASTVIRGRSATTADHVPAVVSEGVQAG